jgi:hypothetical protein
LERNFYEHIDLINVRKVRTNQNNAVLSIIYFASFFTEGIGGGLVVPSIRFDQYLNIRSLAALALLLFPSTVFGPQESPPCIRQRPFNGLSVLALITAFALQG